MVSQDPRRDKGRNWPVRIPGMKVSIAISPRLGICSKREKQGEGSPSVACLTFWAEPSPCHPSPL